MAQGARQNSLFAAEDFTVAYESFAQANLQAYDFETIRNAMVDYISTNYPENFNDYINSSEFIALIELIAFLGHNLAFRADLGQRENYLSTAERRDSALRIAQFLGYTPTRNVVASGYLKIDSVQTDEQVFDASGNSLANVATEFEDVTNPQSYQNFLAIMNAIFQSSSQFGSPFSSATINNVKNEIYRTNSTNNTSVREFSNNVNNKKATFSLHSVGYDATSNALIEKTPSPYSVVDLLYRNDNSGFGSANTGFYIGFKQGSLSFKDFEINNGLPNMAIDINADNVANGQVWVQTIDEAAQVQKTWTRVDRLFGASTMFNARQNKIRDIYSISSRENDQISIVFPDGNFGNIPRGIIRVWYRTGLNQSYTLTPDNFRSAGFTINYISSSGNVQKATFKCSLKSTVSNASERESVASIKDNAPRFFATQDRMVTAEDYAIAPLTASENIRKIKSINRVHSGHSRFRDIYDPTATYSDATQYTDDAYLYEKDVTNRSVISLPTSLTGYQIYDQYLKPLFCNPEIFNFYYNRHGWESTTHDAKTDFSDTSNGITVLNNDGSETNVYRWNQITKGSGSCSGYITYNSVVQRLGLTTTSVLNKADVNGLVEFIDSPYKMGYLSLATVTSGGSGYTSTPTVTITGKGTGATATCTIANGAVTTVAITASGSGYDQSTNIAITGGGGTSATVKATVVDAKTEWVKIDRLYKSGHGDDDSTGTPNGIDNTGKGAVVLSSIVSSGARIRRLVPKIATDLDATTKADVVSKIDNNNTFGLRYNASTQKWVVIQSANLPVSSEALNDPSNWNRQYEGDSSSTGIDQSWIIRLNHGATEWELLSRKTQFIAGSKAKLKFTNLNFNSSFSSETQKALRDNLKVLKINPTSSVDPSPLGKDYQFNAFGYFTYTDGYTDPYNMRVTLADPNNDGYPNDPEAFHKIVGSETIKLGTKTIHNFNYTTYDDDSGTTVVTGIGNLHTQYNRIADVSQLVDPSTTNIIDTYVLLASYNILFRNWALYDAREETKPNPPTISELNDMFESLNTKKAISDQVVYRPVKYKILFGDLASGELQAKFNVTKTSNSTLSDTEIKQKVINLITAYFNIDNWDFGENFYFTEMAAYIHNNMIGEISQITISSVANSTDETALFEITSSSDELFLPVVKSNNINVTSSVSSNLTTIGENTGITNVSTSSGGSY